MSESNPSGASVAETDKRAGPQPDDRYRKLMGAAQRGDSGAYVELLKEITPRLRRAIRGRRSFLDDAEIEDLLQDVLLSLHAVRATYDPSRPFMPWLMAITRNRLADGARRYARQGGREVIFEDLEVTLGAGHTNSMSDDLERQDEDRTLRAAIRDLPQGQRNAIELLKLREMSLREASAASGMTEGALKVATHRAIRALKKMLVERT